MPPFLSTYSSLKTCFLNILWNFPVPNNNHRPLHAVLAEYIDFLASPLKQLIPLQGILFVR